MDIEYSKKQRTFFGIIDSQSAFIFSKLTQEIQVKVPLSTLVCPFPREIPNTLIHIPHCTYDPFVR